MPEISIPTLLLSIESIAREIKELRQTIDDGDAVPEDFPRMDDLVEAALELEREYDKAAQTTLNLIPYDELVGK
jgi:hypothetical protein